MSRIFQMTALTVQVVESLNLPDRPTLADVVAAVEAKYGKEILFEVSDESKLGTGVTGRWLDGTCGVISYLSGPKSWSLHIVLHELSHILLGHKGAPVKEDPTPSYFSGMLGKRRGIARMICRKVDAPLEGREAEAENLAYGLARLIHAPAKPTKAEQVLGL
jgi:hypothetical protein